jgi:hypothetical protein
MHAAHQVFLDAIAGKRRLSVTFNSKKEGRELTRVCAPLDYGPLRGGLDQSPRYQLWNLEGRKKPLNVVLSADEILDIKVLDETFEPADIVTWAFKPGAWAIQRDWGDLS